MLGYTLAFTLEIGEATWCHTSAPVPSSCPIKRAPCRCSHRRQQPDAWLLIACPRDCTACRQEYDLAGPH